MWRIVIRGARIVRYPSKRSRNNCREQHTMPAIPREEEVVRFDPSVPIDKGFTPPSEWYTTPEFYELEKKTIFRKNWLAVGRVDQVSKPGHYFTADMVGEPLLVCRDEKGNLKAFFNVCCHRGMPVAKDDGTVDQFTCSYHGWVYALDGRLKIARKMKGIKDFKASDNGLTSLPVTTWGPMVFVKMTPGQYQTEENMVHLKKLENHLEEFGYSQGNAIFVESKIHQIKSNWKVVVENFSDGGYHVDVTHKKLTDEYYDAKSLNMLEVNEDFTLQVLRSKANTPKALNRIGDWSSYNYIYPNFMISRYGPWLETIMTLPRGYGKTDFVFNFFLDKSYMEKMSKEEAGEYIKTSTTVAHAVQEEDNVVCEAVQKGLASSAYTAGRYAPSVEKSQYVFHTRLAKELRSVYQY